MDGSQVGIAKSATSGTPAASHVSVVSPMIPGQAAREDFEDATSVAGSIAMSSVSTWKAPPAHLVAAGLAPAGPPAHLVAAGVVVVAPQMHQLAVPPKQVAHIHPSGAATVAPPTPVHVLGSSGSEASQPVHFGYKAPPAQLVAAGLAPPVPVLVHGSSGSETSQQVYFGYKAPQPPLHQLVAAGLVNRPPLKAPPPGSQSSYITVPKAQPVYMLNPVSRGWMQHTVLCPTRPLLL